MIIAPTQYLYLPGRSGGQIAYGGIDAGDDLVLHSTAHATKGRITAVDDFYASESATVGTAAAVDSMIRFYSNTTLMYHFYWDESVSRLIISEDSVDNTEDLLSFSASEIAINDSGRDINFRVEGDTDTQLLMCDASTDTVTISGNLSTGKFNVAGTMFINDKLIFTQTDGNEYIDSLADGYMDYGATTAHRFNAGMVGVGVTPKTDWHSIYNGFQIGAGGAIAGYTNGSFPAMEIISNARPTADSFNTGYLYINASEATTYLQDRGHHFFKRAVSGSADGAITWINTLTIDSTGFVGIGITTPDGTLHVHTATAGSVTANTAADDLVVENSGDGGISILGPDASRQFQFFGSPSDAAGASLTWKYDDLLFKVSTNTAGGELSLNTADGVEAVRIDSSQNVGIGTNSPNYQLHQQIAGTALTHNLRNNAAAASGNYGEIAFQTWSGSGSGLNTFGGAGTSRPSVVLRGLSEDNSARGAFVVATFSGGADNTNLTEKFRVTSGGDVGIGITPTVKLHISEAQNSTTQARIQNLNDGNAAVAQLNLRQGIANEHDLNLFVADTGATVTGYAQRANFTTDTTSLGITLAARGASGDIRLYVGDSSPTLDADETVIIDSVGVTIKNPGNTPILRITGADTAPTALTATMSGFELNRAGMNSTSKYGRPIKFTSTDSAFSTETPKLLAAIVPRATEAYGADTDSGMAIDFFTSPDNGGTADTTALGMSLTQQGRLTVGGIETASGMIHSTVLDALNIPCLYLDQQDLSEEIMEIASTAGVGNAIELVGAKALTVTEFIKVTINGSTRYIEAGTIA